MTALAALFLVVHGVPIIRPQLPAELVHRCDVATTVLISDAGR